MPAKIETNTYTTPAPTLIDPEGIKNLEEGREVIKVYNKLHLDLHRALVQREQVINAMAASIASVVLAHMQGNAAGVFAGLEMYVAQHVNVHGPGAAPRTTH